MNNKYFKYIKSNANYFAPKFLDNKKVIIGFSTRLAKKNKNFDLGFANLPEEEVINNRKIFFNEFNINFEKIICAAQIHSDGIAIVGANDTGKGAVENLTFYRKVDGFITNEKNVPITIRSADCIPVIIISEDYEVISVLHSGWKSTLLNILKNAINIINDKFNISPKKLKIIIGPGICGNCFEVKESVFKLFKDQFPYYKKFTLFPKINFYIDLKKIIKTESLDSGIKKNNIFDINLCTKEDSRFFSYRRDKSIASLMSFGMLI